MPAAATSFHHSCRAPGLWRCRAGANRGCAEGAVPCFWGVQVLDTAKYAPDPATPADLDKYPNLAQACSILSGPPRAQSAERSNSSD